MGSGRVRVSHAHARRPAARSRYDGSACGGDAACDGPRNSCRTRDGLASSQPGDHPTNGASEGDDQADRVRRGARADAQAAGDDPPWTSPAGDDSAGTHAEAADTRPDSRADSRADARPDSCTAASCGRPRRVRDRACGPRGGAAHRGQTRADVP